MLQFHTRRFWISPVVNGPLMIGNVVGHLIVIPRYGAMGAAAVTAGTSVLKLAFELLLAWRLFGVGPGEICVASRADMATFFDRLAGLFGGKREPEGSQ